MDENKLANIHALICKLFKIDSLKEYQKTCLNDLSNGRDCFICQPTGSGKSIVFQALPFYVHGKECTMANEEEFYETDFTVIVVSPLLSLVKDQEKILKKLGIRVTSLHDAKEENDGCEEILVNDLIKEIDRCNIIYTSPEAILTRYRNLLKNRSITNLAAIVIDESHCVKKWGSSSNESEAFRSQYANSAELRSLVPKTVPVVALTATATKETRNFIIENLSLIAPKIYTASPGKENIKFTVIQITEASVEFFFSPIINELSLKCYKASRILIFCRLIKDLRLIYDMFEDAIGNKFANYKKRPFAMFHTKTDDAVKEHVLEEFTRVNGTVRVLIATIAFGMGVDCKELHTVIHFGPSASLEDYVQEAGRAGRDGESSNAILVLKPRALSSQNIRTTMKDYARNKDQCRRLLLLTEFGCLPETQIKQHDCCDICEEKCSCLDCNSGTLSKKVWWKSNLGVKESHALHVSQLNIDGKTELRIRLSSLREKLLFEEGQISNDILSGFPLQSIDEIIDICHEKISCDDIYNSTSVLRRNIIESIVVIIRDVFNEFDCTNDVRSYSDGEGSDEYLSDNESNCSIEFHVNLHDSGDDF